MTHTARMVSRQEYFNSLHFVMQNAKNSIKGSITGSHPTTPEQNDQVQGILNHIGTAKSRGVVIQYLLPKSQDRIMVASAYKEAGAEIRFHPGLLVSDLRYTVVDNNHTVIGLATTTGQNQPTREGYVIPSEGFAQIFLRQFQDRWEEAWGMMTISRTYFQRLKVTIPPFQLNFYHHNCKFPSTRSRGFWRLPRDSDTVLQLLISTFMKKFAKINRLA